MYRDWFPNKYLIGLVPPNSTVPDEVKAYAYAHFTLDLFDVERCIFGDPLIGKTSN